ncbi:MAG: S-adenosylmethionine:tRNA ribosyltransferase-isomerase [Mariniphaga sp.]|nr:S-adenosylmethionine:tRNA ribosyltransferase-isomerase [Mariniphaga sp.]
MKKLKNNIGAIKTADFNYNLPDKKIAKYPLEKRADSKLLIWKNGNISQSVFNTISDILPDGSLLVFNNTKVVRARLKFQKDTGARIEIFCLEPYEPSDYQISFAEKKSVQWKCIIGNAKKWKSGKLKMAVKIKNQSIQLSVESINNENENNIIRFEWDGGYTFSEIIEHAGIIPIPPYLNRESEETDKTRYQTVFAKIKGSVAAPTAGLHFTDSIIKKLGNRGINSTEITLHVGAGTFKPVKSETIEGHSMHSETVAVSLQFLKKLFNHQNKVIAVGTTSVRSLESLYWLGKQLQGVKVQKDIFHISQWEAYTQHADITLKEALAHIINYLENNNQTEIHFTTQIIIVPGYQFRIIDGMFTNFHQPQSTLLLLIGAFLGNDWRKVYDFALKNSFRFLSYGDSNLYLK